jgi:ABC-type branched-subunit amino acid transport system ATPase component
MQVLEIHNVRGGYIPELDILQGIDLTLSEGDVVGVLGLNGSGKSTLGKAIMNMIPRREGEIRFCGKSITSLTTHELAMQGIAIMQQGGQVFNTMSVWENLQLAFGDKKNDEYVAVLKEILPLLARPKKELQHTMADKLSGGQRHQLALAMTLARQPKLAILDEPSAGLSPKSVEEMYAILQQVREQLGVTMVLIEQNIAKAIDFCDRSILLAQGTIAQEFTDATLADIEKIMFNKR